jgi:hypothetical protein
MENRGAGLRRLISLVVPAAIAALWAAAPAAAQTGVLEPPLAASSNVRLVGHVVQPVPDTHPANCPTLPRCRTPLSGP